MEATEPPFRSHILLSIFNFHFLIARFLEHFQHFTSRLLFILHLGPFSRAAAVVWFGILHYGAAAKLEINCWRKIEEKN